MSRANRRRLRRKYRASRTQSYVDRTNFKYRSIFGVVSSLSKMLLIAKIPIDQIVIVEDSVKSVTYMEKNLYEFLIGPPFFEPYKLIYKKERKP